LDGWFFLGRAALVLLRSLFSFWLFLRKKGLPQKVLMRTSQQLDCFFGGGIFEEIFFILMLVVSDVWIFFYDALFKRAAIFTTPLNLMDIFFHDFKVVNSNGVCFFFKKAQCFSGINFFRKFPFQKKIPFYSFP
jgi:hypothetical protein